MPIPDAMHRRSLRLRHYDYSQPGAYFVTVCSKSGRHVFGEVQDGHMQLNPFGEHVSELWYGLSERFPNVECDAYIVMPNHVHGVLIFGNENDVTLGRVIGTFKSLAVHGYKRGVTEHGWPHYDGDIWQRNYFEHVIRRDRALNRIRAYIHLNPQRWDLDPDNR